MLDDGHFPWKPSIQINFDLPSNNSKDASTIGTPAFQLLINTNANATFNIRHKIMNEIQIQSLADIKPILSLYVNLEHSVAERCRLIDVSPLDKHTQV